MPRLNCLFRFYLVRIWSLTTALKRFLIVQNVGWAWLSAALHGPPHVGTLIFLIPAVPWNCRRTINFFGNQAPITGEGYCGGYSKLINFEYREYLTAPLTEPLIAGTFYYVSFYVSPGETFGCAIDRIGAYFSINSPNGSQNTAINVTPQVESDQGFLDDFVNWILIEGCFQAEGGEAFITIGNFHNDANTPLNPGCSSGNAYYYYENISVVEGMEPATIDLDLGGPEEACFSYEIDPGISGYTFTWEGGSHGPTLTVTESGVYSLTISDGCNYGVD